MFKVGVIGVGSNNELVHGMSGYGGEVGHMVIVPNGLLCGCGKEWLLIFLWKRSFMATETLLLATGGVWEIGKIATGYNADLVILDGEFNVQ